MTQPERLFRIDKWKYFDLIDYKPHPRQILFHESNARFKIPVCGRRMGKTVMGARELEPLMMMPNKRLWIVGVTYDLEKKKLLSVAMQKNKET